MLLETNGKNQLNTKNRNEEVLRIVQENRGLLKATDKRRGRMFWDLIRHDSILRNVVERRIERQSGRGRPRQSN